MLLPKNKRLKDYKFCFYGHEFKKNGNEIKEEFKKLEEFLKTQNMEIAPLVEPGKWLWSGLIKRMSRSAFCIFETQSQNRNVHIELGYALAKGLNVILIIPEDKKNGYQEYLPSDLAGLLQIRYTNPDELAPKLEKEIPARYYSVEERLSIDLQNISITEKIYFQIILERKTISFSELVAKAHTKAIISSDNIYLANFIRKYDEALMIDRTDHLDRYNISIDPDYKEFICRKLGLKTSDT